ncbi:hypothetical protein OG887_42885 (plasmid) [Streptomyces sp. NBC_00053]|uniref:hypothetical protein n=1 Tax=unclassified Streptomyces TaxID=2593676 RepID=UPI00224E022A|nr:MULTISPECIES: hypothetical protein [unclassified Streptomyces]MCX4400129.1 hypothetical protein [Streptomyces sp. NBC_01767]MCX5103018.1 hypothetical protein [Streptomyces sp. NBC_00439]MCX5106691.1 hypothetical protein [Streptomyces sp. NBC_00439]MCX5505518.1 hypothetical protein [Streptomyces sp. NBC_00052]MCX5545942.1 hypothetical protein [Streptomyces sp. NBC_00051]
MSKSAFGIDAAWERVIEARAQSDTRAEALAWSLLGQALYEVGRTEEADEVRRQGIVRAQSCADVREVLLAVSEALMARGAELEEAAGPEPLEQPHSVFGAPYVDVGARYSSSGSREGGRLLANARNAYDGALAALMELAEEARARRATVTPDEDKGYRARALPPPPSGDGREILRSRFQALMARGAELEEAAGPEPLEQPDSAWGPSSARVGEQYSSGVGERGKLLANARNAYDGALAALMELAEEARTRLWAVSPGKDKYRAWQPSMPMHPQMDPVVVILGGFLAVKVLGPFLEEWATKLGEQFGESTVRVLGRIRLRRSSRSDNAQGELEAAVPDPHGRYGPHPATTLVIPSQLSDAARLAILDLDPADDAVRGASLYWVERRGAWISEQELEADESLRGWVVRYTWAVSEGTNRHPRHTYDEVPTRGEAVGRAMRAHRDAPDLNAVHIRRAYEEDWGDPVRPIPSVRPIPPGRVEPMRGFLIDEDDN